MSPNWIYGFIEIERVSNYLPHLIKNSNIYQMNKLEYKADQQVWAKYLVTYKVDDFIYIYDVKAQDNKRHMHPLFDSNLVLHYDDVTRTLTHLSLGYVKVFLKI